MIRKLESHQKLQSYKVHHPIIKLPESITTILFENGNIIKDESKLSDFLELIELNATNFKEGMNLLLGILKKDLEKIPAMETPLLC